MNVSVDEVGIALVHTSFNIFSTLLLLPFTKQLEKLAHIIVKDGAEHMQKQDRDGKKIV